MMLSKLVFVLFAIVSHVGAKSFKIELEKVAVDASTKRRLGHTNGNSIRLANYFNYQYIGTLYFGSQD